MSGTGTSQKLFRLAATRSHKDLGLRYEDESQVCVILNTFWDFATYPSLCDHDVILLR